MIQPVASTDPEESARIVRRRQADRRQWQLLFAGVIGLAIVLAVCTGVALKFAR